MNDESARNFNIILCILVNHGVENDIERVFGDIRTVEEKNIAAQFQHLPTIEDWFLRRSRYPTPANSKNWVSMVYSTIVYEASTMVDDGISLRPFLTARDPGIRFLFFYQNRNISVTDP